jgi:monoamine oxidase
LLQAVVERQAKLVAQWTLLGFIHGVMNTDNCAISGETIDYGPCAFMDAYDPNTVFSSIDHAGRYRYGHQPRIVQWNLARLAEALLPLLSDDEDQAVSRAQDILASFADHFQAAWRTGMTAKLGLHTVRDGDEALAQELLQAMAEAKADFCVCTIPLGVLTQVESNLSPKLKAAVAAVPYSNSVKIGLKMRKRFWEEEEAIYGGHSFTNQEIALISYPNHNFFGDGPAVLLGAFAGGVGAYHLAGMTPQQRIAAALEQGSVFHPDKYKAMYMNGASVAWSRVPWTMGCCARWTEETRKEHYQTPVTMENRVVLAGEHASYVGCWMEGALLSSIDAITQLHQRAQAA